MTHPQPKPKGADIAARISAAAKRWAEAVALVDPAKSRWWDAVSSAQKCLPSEWSDDGFIPAGPVRMFDRQTTHDYIGGVLTRGEIWTYTEHMGELAGQDASADPLCIELSDSYAAKVAAVRAAGSARGALLRITKAAIQRGEL